MPPEVLTVPCVHVKPNVMFCFAIFSADDYLTNDHFFRIAAALLLMG